MSQGSKQPSQQQNDARGLPSSRHANPRKVRAGDVSGAASILPVGSKVLPGPGSYWVAPGCMKGS
eukprot:355176-Chlamydomonas_euryale.AAC.2